MNVLIVYAHPEPTSFTGALKDTAVQTLVSAGRIMLKFLIFMRKILILLLEDIISPQLQIQQVSLSGRTALCKSI